MARTKCGLLCDLNLRWSPVGQGGPSREVRLGAGAGLVWVVCGELLTMGGLPRVPSAESIRLNDEGQIEGLF